MKQINDNVSDEFLTYSRQMIIDEKLITGQGPDGGPALIGQLEGFRFATQIRQLELLEILQPAGKLSPADVMTTDYLPKH
ncbi:MAG: hypothetical protein J6386_10365 [Candidatus Synoicihabitans palmerolidicus]|nr:hypothetical protein [Candidatus Synoicihabitans palmerolidicus]